MILIDVALKKGLPQIVKLRAVFTQTNSIKVFCYFVTPRSKFFWDGGFLLNQLASFWVGNSQAPGMKHKPRDPERLAAWFAVNGVTKQGPTKKTIVNPDLLRPARMQCAKNQ